MHVSCHDTVGHAYGRASLGRFGIIVGNDYRNSIKSTGEPPPHRRKHSHAILLMLDNSQIDALVSEPKQVTDRKPAADYRLDRGSYRCDLELESIGEPKHRFAVFVRRHAEFAENFSIGLMYRSDHPRFRTVTLVRYNGPHGESSYSEDGHFSRPHIHYMRESELNRGHSVPQPRCRELTDRFTTFDQALNCFFTDTNIADYGLYFPHLTQGNMLDEFDFS